MREFNTPQAERILQACKERKTKVVAVEEVGRNWFRFYQHDYSKPGTIHQPLTGMHSQKSSMEDDARAKRLYTSIAQRVIGHTIKASLGKARIEEVESGPIQTQGAL